MRKNEPIKDVEVNFAEIAALTGLHYRLIKKKIGDVKPVRVESTCSYFSLKEILPFLYASAKKDE